MAVFRRVRRSTRQEDKQVAISLEAAERTRLAKARWGLSSDAPPSPVRQPSRKAAVYIIVEQGTESPVKVGLTRNLESRLAALQVSNWRHLVVAHSVWFPAEQAARVELKAHIALNNKRHQGEWFAVTVAEARQFLEGCNGNGETGELRKTLGALRLDDEIEAWRQGQNGE